MMYRNALRLIVPLVILIALGALAGLTDWLGPRHAQLQAGATPSGVEANRPTFSADEKAIRAVDDVFMANYNKGDSHALTALFTDDAEVVEADGKGDEFTDWSR